MPYESTTLTSAIQTAFDDVLTDSGEPPSLNEAETRTHLIDPVLLTLGYTSLATIRREYRLKASGQFVDYLLQAGPRRVVVEAKTVSQELTPKDSGQLVGYCAQEGIRWALLTNGIEWHIFDVDLPGGWEAKRIIKLDILGGYRTGTLGELVASLAHFARQSLSESEDAVDAWSESTRALAILSELISAPDSVLTTAAVNELADRGVVMDPTAVVAALRQALGGEAAKPATPQAVWPPEPASSGESKSHPPLGAAQGVACYLFSASAQGGNDGQTGLDVLKELLGAERWGVRTKAGLRIALKPGDRCCFYAAGSGVVAEAEVAGPPASQPSADGYYPISLTNVRWLATPIAVDAPLRTRLEAFAGKDPNGVWSWFVQGSMRGLTSHDYSLLTGGGGA